MSSKTILKPIITILLITLFAVAGHAGKKGLSGGAVIYTSTDELLDFEEARSGSGLVPFSPSSLPLFNSHLYPRIVAISQKSLQSVATMLLKKLASSQAKTWYFTNSPIKDREITAKLHVLKEGQCGKSSENRKKCEVIAIQDSEKVIVYKPWLERKMNGSEENKLTAVGMLVHEALIDYALEFEIPHDNVRHVTRAIFAVEMGGALPQPHEMLNILNKYGFVLPVRETLQQQAEDLTRELEKIRNMLVSQGINPINYFEQLINMRGKFDYYRRGRADVLFSYEWSIYWLASTAAQTLRAFSFDGKDREALNYIDRLISHLNQYPDNFTTITDTF